MDASASLHMTGRAPTTMEGGMRLAVGQPAPEVRFGSAAGDIALAELHHVGPVVLAFLRHLG